jgi:GYF domain 2
MNYFVIRNGQEYGPYSLADLQRYVASGQILVSDMARSEGMSEPLPVSQIVGTIPVPVPSAPAATLGLADYPDPPNLHWGLVLLFGIISCGIFSLVWDLIQAAWMKKVAPQSRAIFYYIGGAGILVAIFFSSFAMSLSHSKSPFTGLLNLAYYIILLVGRFSMRNSLEEHYNSVERMGLALSGVMTFFFGGIYFQYHLNEIVRRKNAVRMGMVSA